MTAATPEPKARRTGGRSARVRASVLAATMHALLTDGPDGLSIHEIAHRAGVHETSVYRRWGTKANLILDAVASETQAAIPAPDTGSVRGDLLALIGSIAAFLTTPTGEILLRLAVMHDDLPEDRTIRQLFWAERFTAGRAVLERAQARGELRTGLDYRLTVETLVGAICVRLLLSREPVDATLAENVVDLILTGITQ